MTPEPTRATNGTRPSNMAGVMDRNINALLQRGKADNRARSRQDRIADAISAFAGSMPFVYLHLAVFGAWVVINLGLTPIPRFDPTFVVLATFASVEAIFLSTFVLISQNRMTAMADRRADLDLQISLLSEHEVTRLITLVESIAKRLDVDASIVPDLSELKQDVEPEKVLDRLQQAHEAFEEEQAEPRDGKSGHQRPSGT